MSYPWCEGLVGMQYPPLCSASLCNMLEALVHIRSRPYIYLPRAHTFDWQFHCPEPNVEARQAVKVLSAFLKLEFEAIPRA